MDLKKSNQNPEILVDSKLAGPRFVEDKFNAKSGMGWRVAVCTFYDSPITKTHKTGTDPIGLFANAIADDKSDFLHPDSLKIKPDYVANIITKLKQPKGNGLVEIVSQTEYCHNKNLLLIINRFDNFFYNESSLKDKLLFLYNLYYAIKEDDLSFYLLFTYKSQLYKDGIKQLDEEIKQDVTMTDEEKIEARKNVSALLKEILKGEIPLYMLTNTDWDIVVQPIKIKNANEESDVLAGELEQETPTSKITFKKRP